MINCVYELEKQKEPKWNYPCLGVFCGSSIPSDLIVLFKSKGCGTTIKGDCVGEFVTIWCMSDFRPLKSTERVTLTNKDY